jgi:Flp pilus assembly protein TadD
VAVIVPALSRRLRLGVGLALALCAVATYAGRLSGPFLFDDEQSILDNTSIRSRSLSDWLSPPRETPVAGRPLLNLSFALDHALFGLSPRAFHTTNLGLHVLCAWLVFLILVDVLRSVHMPHSVRERAVPYALLTALCFDIHPLATEIVLYTTQRSEVLVALAYLVTLLLFVRHANQQRVAMRHWLAVMLVGLLGAASKEVYVSMLPVALCFDRAFLAGSFRAALRERLPLYLALFPSIMALCVLQLHDPRPESVRFAELSYVLAQAEIIPRYFRAAFWPSHLSFDYGPLWPASSAPAWYFLLGTGLVLCVAALSAFRYPRLGFAALWIFGILAPSSSVFSIHTEVGAERRFYLPLAALLAYAIVGVGELFLRRWQRRPEWALAMAAAALIALGVRTRARAADFRSTRSVWQSAVQARPDNARAHYNLAETYRREGDLPAAILELRAALAAHEAYPDAHSNLAGALLTKGDLSAAVRHLQRAAALAPEDSRVHVNYATALGLSGRTAAAAHELQIALRLQPDSLDAHRRLAVALSLLGRSAEAQEQARWVLSRTDRDPTALRILLEGR